MLKNILAAVDGSDASMRAVVFAADLAKTYDAKLTLFHVQAHIGSAQIPEELQEYAGMEHIRVTERDVLRSVVTEILRRAQTAAHEAGANNVTTEDEFGDVAGRIIEYAAKHGPDLIVLGSRGLGPLKGVALGSVSHKVTHLAKCPTVTVH